MLKGRRLQVFLVVIVLMVASVWASAASAAPRIVTLWSYAPQNIQEWNLRKPDIEARFGISLNIVAVSEGVFARELQAKMAEGKGGPDIIDWRIENNQVVSTDPTKSLLLPLDNFIRESKVFRNIAPGRVSWVKHGNSIFGLPREAGSAALVYNDTLWKSVGVDVATLETWNDFFLAASKLAAEKQDGKPVHYALPTLGPGLSDTMFMIWQQSGAQILDVVGSPRFTNPGFTAFVKQWIRWFNTGTFLSCARNDLPMLLRNGALSSYVSPDWMVGQMNQAAKEGAYQFRVRALPCYQKAGPRTASWGGSFLALVKTAQRADALYPVIEYMQYHETGLKPRLDISAVLPPLAGPWTNASLLQPDPRFGGQNLRQLQVELVKEMPVATCHDIFWDAISDFNSEYPTIQTGRVTVEQGLESVQAKVLRRKQIVRPARPDNLRAF